MRYFLLGHKGRGNSKVHREILNNFVVLTEHNCLTKFVYIEQIFNVKNIIEQRFKIHRLSRLEYNCRLHSLLEKFPRLKV